MFKKQINNLRIDFYDNNIHINNSYEYEDPDDMRIIIEDIINNEDTKRYAHRSINSYVNEWCAYNLLYNLNFHKDRTESVDLNYPQKMLYKIGYFILGNLYKIVY